jgi:hypothetical protein
VSGAKLKSAVFYLQPRKLWQRLVLAFPEILTLLLIAFCSWQLLRIVSAIYAGNSFNQLSARRIAAIGWAIVFTVILLFILHLLQANIASAVTLKFNSTIPNYR